MNLAAISWTDFLDFIIRFVFNLGVIVILVRVLYYQTTTRKDYFFTYLLISQVVFFISFLLESLNLGLGFALGLFAIFGIIRYRTRQIEIREMTYLFMVIGVSVINALTDWQASWLVLLFANGTVVLFTYLLERIFFIRHESRKIVNYDNIENIKPENYQELKQDLEKRTGLRINRIEIGRIDLLRDTARVFIYYYETENRPNAADDEYNDDGDDD